MTKNIIVGSAAWTSDRDLVDEYAERVVQFRKYTSEAALCEYASSLRGHGVSCVVEEAFSVGRHNVVRKLRFEDGVAWVARMRMPPIWGDDEGSQGAVNVAMSSELATMEFIRQNTDIRVPKVYGFDLDIDNDVGCPVVLMEYIPGSNAAKVAQMYPGEHEGGGVPAAFRDKFWRQVADVMIKMAAVRLAKIGSLFREGSSPGSFTIGPVIKTLSGPYDSAAEFYAEFPAALGRTLSKYKKPVDGQEELLQAFASLAASFADDREDMENQGGFGLANYGLDPSNVLVDAEFNVLAVMDWDSVMALPDAALHRLPRSMGAEAAIPGVEEEEAVAEKNWALVHEFTRVVGEQAKQQSEEGLFSLSKAGFYSKEAVAFRSLIEVQKKQVRVNRTWVHCLEWLADHGDEELGQFYEEH